MATMNHLDTTGSAFEAGQKTEDRFAAIARASGYSVTNANSRQERIDHFDFIIQRDKGPLRVEVKGIKNFAILHNGRMTKDFFLIEWVGVAGFQGWIDGKADIIAFEREDGFYLVPRKTLLNVASRLCSSDLVSSREKMLYKSYRRNGRMDEVSAILISDILATRNFTFWKK